MTYLLSVVISRTTLTYKHVKTKTKMPQKRKLKLQRETKTKTILKTKNTGHGLDSRPPHYRVATLGKSFTCAKQPVPLKFDHIAL